MRLLCYLDDWLIIAELWTLLLQHRDLVLQLCRDLGIIVNWEKSDLQPSTRVQHLEMLIDMSHERLFPSQACLGRFREVATSFSLASVSLSELLAAVVRPHGFDGALSSLGSLPHASAAVVPQGPLVLHGVRPGHSDPSVAGVRGGSSLVTP